MGWRGDCELNMQNKQPWGWPGEPMSPSGEGDQPRSSQGQCSADRSALKKPQHHHGCVAQGHSQLHVRWSSTQHRLLVGVMTGLAIRVSNCPF